MTPAHQPHPPITRAAQSLRKPSQGDCEASLRDWSLRSERGWGGGQATSQDKTQDHVDPDGSGRHRTEDPDPGHSRPPLSWIPVWSWAWTLSMTEPGGDPECGGVVWGVGALLSRGRFKGTAWSSDLNQEGRLWETADMMPVADTGT